MVAKIGVSLIIPTYKEAANLGRLLPYLRRHAPHASLEILVIDGTQTCKESQALCQTHDARYIIATQCQRSIQLDQGASEASHDILFFLHADVTPPTDYFDLIIQSMSEPNICGCFSYRFDSTSRLLAINASTTKKVGLFTGGGDQGLVITKKDYNRLGGYDISVTFMEDFEFYDRIKASNLSFIIINGECTISARKYEKNSYLKVNFIHFLIFSGYKLGISSNRLASAYKKWMN